MPNPLERAIADAARVEHKLQRELWRLGTLAHPRGKILVAYRNARRLIRAALKLTGVSRAAALRDALDGLKQSVRAQVRETFETTQGIGGESANAQADYYASEIERLALPDSLALLLVSQQVAGNRTLSVNAVEQLVDAQAAQILALANFEQDDAILGDRRVGALNPTPVVALAFFHAVSLYGNAWVDTLDGRLSVLSGKELRPFKKQAIAAIDERTTPCCLAVHAHIVPFEDDFILTADPRPYGDEVAEPPFHYYCRTALVLYNKLFDLGLTEQMRAAADVAIAERARTGSSPRHPAHARS